MRVSANSEPLAEEDREAIQAAWNAPVHNLWGSTEIGVQAVGCGRGDGLHVCEDEVVLERVDAGGIPVAPDQPAARTLATGLANWTFPFIRYDLGDEVTTLTGRCGCGSSMARVADIAGRRDDDFRYSGHTVPASVPPCPRHEPGHLRVPGATDQDGGGCARRRRPAGHRDRDDRAVGAPAAPTLCLARDRRLGRRCGTISS